MKIVGHTMYELRTINLAWMMLREMYHTSNNKYRFLGYLLDDNPSCNLPYHNKFHTATMLANCMPIMLENYERTVLNSSVVKETIDNLALAILFHDWNHSGGKYSDAVNVRRAIKAFRTWAAKNFREKGQDFEEKCAVVERLIKVTQYPYVVEPVTFEERLIRDADLMTPYEDNWYEMLFGGLRLEMSTYAHTQMSIIDFGNKQLEFMLGVKWNTAAAENRASRDWQSALDRIRYAISTEQMKQIIGGDLI